ncbi:MAG: metalloregulator ArsR/SmtB family transcription factor [Anaerolineales bacterium]|nr:metalloregulator ArsR/SmtB family transcription factor [Anaerolineales bacterium]
MSVYEIIAEPKRRDILDLLLQRPHLVGELVDKLGISQPNVSKHLRVLRRAGLVQARQDAQRRWYALQPEPLEEIDQWLAGYRQIWDARFERLDDYLVQHQSKEKHDDHE